MGGRCRKSYRLMFLEASTDAWISIEQRQGSRFEDPVQSR